ncbi:MAG: IS982 family transposase [Bacteroidales bacterium]|nr:IS982 family transposase [Bacteroidales bacterium]
MLSDNKVIEIFYMADDFCNFFNETVKKHSIDDGKKHRNKPSRLSDSEIMTILIMFHMGGFRCLKHFYVNYICKHCSHLFPRTVSYNRFVELEKKVAVPLLVFVKEVLLGKCTGVNFVDSTPLRVCRNQRIHCHKVFKGIAMRGQSSMGWFFGFKLHLIINEKGEILNFMITSGNVDDRVPLKYENFVKEIYGKLVGDKGYISQELFRELFVNGIQLVTKIKNNMKNSLMSMSDKILLRKRALIESTNDELKNIAQIEHSRHRSFSNFIVNTIAAIAAYCYFPKKPSISIEHYHDKQLVLF